MSREGNSLGVSPRGSSLGDEPVEVVASDRSVATGGTLSMAAGKGSGKTLSDSTGGIFGLIAWRIGFTRTGIGPEIDRLLLLILGIVWGCNAGGLEL